jgi:hypothetical protein
MTDFRADLERLDAKAGKIHTRSDCSVAYRKSIDTPELLDDRDLTLIGFVHGDKGVSEARMRQMKSAAAIAEAQAPMPIKSAETKAPAMTKTALEARVALLEQKPSVNFRGVFEPGKSYQPGDACTHSGGLWICRAETTGQPNQDFHGWTLAVKSRSIA